MEETFTSEAPANEQDKQEGLEPHLFNQESRDALEEAFQEFQEEAAAPPEEAPEVPPDKPADKGMEVSQAQVIPPEESRPTFKTLEDADRSYHEARKKMNEATERAKQLERENEEVRRTAAEVVEYVRRQTAAQTPAPPRQAPAFNKEEMEARFYEDPVGFVVAATEAGRQAAIREAQQNTANERDRMRKQAAVESFTNQTQKYFDENYADLKAIEPMVTHEITQVWNDPNFTKPLLEDRGRDVLTKARTVVDEATRRLKDRLPGLADALGRAGTDSPNRERLASGAPPLVPGGSRSAPAVSPTPEIGESNQDYLRGRLKRLERMQQADSVR